MLPHKRPCMEKKRTPFKPFPSDKILFKCPGCDNDFDYEKSYTMHLARSPACCNIIFKLQIQAAIPSNFATARHMDIQLEAATDNTLPIIDQQNTQQKKNCQLTGDVVELNLLKLVNDFNCDHSIFEGIMNWAKESARINYPFQTSRTTRSAQINYLESWLGLSYLRPKQADIGLPGPLTQIIPVTYFEFTDMLESLLTTKDLFSDLDNLDVNRNDPYSRYSSPDGKLSCPNSSQWYKNAWKHCCKEPEDMLVPIIFACDETQLGNSGACPLLFTTTLLNQEQRNKATSWRPLGFIYDLHILQSKTEYKKQSPEFKSLRLHAIYKAVLKSFEDAQKTDILKNKIIQFGDFPPKEVNIKVPLHYIIGDMQGGDKMCGSSISYRDSLQRPCRKCNVLGKELGNPYTECQKIVQKKVVDLIINNENEKLKKINQMNVYIGFFDLDYGGCKFGIFSACCPVEPLHSVEIGIMKNLLATLFYDHLKDSGRLQLDILVEYISNLDRQHFTQFEESPTFPRSKWPAGCCSIKSLEAKYHVGLIFTIVLVYLTDSGKEFFDLKFKNSPELSSGMMETFQMVLCYWRWLKKVSYWKRGDKEKKNEAKTAIQAMLNRIKIVWPRETGQGWSLAKFHEQLHVPDDIERNGPPRGYHSGPIENNHIHLLKKNYNNTQKNKRKLDYQLGNRLAEKMIIDTAYNKTRVDEDDEDELIVGDADGIPSNSSKVIFRSKTSLTIPNKTELVKNVDWIFEEDVIEFLYDFYELSTDGKQARFIMYTEYKREHEIFRAHPNYRSEGTWYDWAIFKFEKNLVSDQDIKKAQSNNIGYGDDFVDYKKYYYLPGKIYGFIYMKEVLMAVVCVCSADCTRTSVFSTEWKVAMTNKGKRIFEMITVQAIVRPCMMIQKDELGFKFQEIWHPERWSDEFLP